jgi:hypothetical protein
MTCGSTHHTDLPTMTEIQPPEHAHTRSWPLLSCPDTPPPSYPTTELLRSYSNLSGSTLVSSGASTVSDIEAAHPTLTRQSPAIAHPHQRGGQSCSGFWSSTRRLFFFIITLVFLSALALTLGLGFELSGYCSLPENAGKCSTHSSVSQYNASKFGTPLWWSTYGSSLGLSFGLTKRGVKPCLSDDEACVAPQGETFANSPVMFKPDFGYSFEFMVAGAVGLALVVSLITSWVMERSRRGPTKGTQMASK